MQFALGGDPSQHHIILVLQENNSLESLCLEAFHPSNGFVNLIGSFVAKLDLQMVYLREPDTYDEAIALQALLANELCSIEELSIINPYPL